MRSVPQYVERARHVRLEVWDGALALVLLAAGLIEITHPLHDPRGLTNNGFFAIAVLVVWTGALLWRRRFPFGAFAVAWVPAFVGPFFHLTDVVSEFAALELLTYGCIAAGQRGQLRPYAVAVLAVAVILSHLNPNFTPLPIIAYNVALFVVPLAAGFAQRRRRRIRLELEQRSAELAAQGRRLAEQTVLEERARIAGELSRAVVACVAEMATANRRAQASLQAGGRTAAADVGRVSEIGRLGLLELRRLLGVLRSEHDPGPPLSVAETVHEQAVRRTGGGRPQLVAGGLRSVGGWLALPGRWSRFGWDALIVAVLSASNVYELLSPVTGPGTLASLTHLATVALGIGLALPLILRRRFPLLAVALVVASQHAIGIWLPLYLNNTDKAIAIVALFSVASRCSPGVAVGVALFGMSLTFAGFSTFERLTGVGAVGQAIANTVLYGFGAWWGATARSAEALNRELREANGQLAAGYEREGRRAAVEERSRIAREMHDAVGHSLSLMIVQAEGARAGLEASPESAMRALDTVQRVGAQAFDELETILDILGEKGRSDPQAGFGEHVDVHELVTQVRQAGMSVELLVEGGARPISGGFGVTVYRIVQEALTNVRKHATEAVAHVRLDFLEHGLQLEVVNEALNNGRPAPTLPGGGHGLVGMRERVAAFGGRFDAGPLPTGGFRVWAEIPWTEAGS